jgi:hypothetical protein
MDYLYFVLAIAAAGIFFWLRSSHRIVYGFIEVLVGVTILAARFLVAGPDLITNDDVGSFLYEPLWTLIGVFTGIYAIVRGLDNIVSTLRDPHALR